MYLFYLTLKTGNCKIALGIFVYSVVLTFIYKIQFASLMQARERWQIPRWSCPLLLAQYFQRLRPGR